MAGMDCWAAVPRAQGAANSSQFQQADRPSARNRGSRGSRSGDHRPVGQSQLHDRTRRPGGSPTARFHQQNRRRHQTAREFWTRAGGARDQSIRGTGQPGRHRSDRGRDLATSSNITWGTDMRLTEKGRHRRPGSTQATTHRQRAIVGRSVNRTRRRPRPTLTILDMSNPLYSWRLDPRRHNDHRSRPAPPRACVSWLPLDGMHLIGETQIALEVGTGEPRVGLCANRRQPDRQQS